MALIYVDMDNVIVDFKSALRKRGIDQGMKNADNLDGIFSEMDPMPGAIDGYNKLVEMGHDVYILSTAPWANPSAWSDKLLWVKEYLCLQGLVRIQKVQSVLLVQQVANQTHLLFPLVQAVSNL